MRLVFVIMSFFLLGAGTVQAEMVAVAGNVAEIRSSPSGVLSTVLWQVPRYYPLSARESQGDFFKVTDYQGNRGWVRKESVDKTRAVVIKVKRANIRKGPGLNNPIVFKALNGVAFKVIGAKGDWLQVEHESGVTGWLFKDLAWSNAT